MKHPKPKVEGESFDTAFFAANVFDLGASRA